jgi:hypothetical protein
MTLFSSLGFLDPITKIIITRTITKIRTILIEINTIRNPFTSECLPKSVEVGVVVEIADEVGVVVGKWLSLLVERSVAGAAELIQMN